MDAYRASNQYSSLRYAARFGHASALATSYADEIRIMIEHIQKFPIDTAWAHARILLACTALANVEASSQTAADRVLGADPSEWVDLQLELAKKQADEKVAS